MRAVICLLALSTGGCNVFGPSPSIDGQWTGSLGKFSFVCMNLQQNGDTITGTAASVSDGFLLYKDVPVRGEHPNVNFTVGVANTEACCQQMAGMTFSGKQDSTEDIVGRYGTGDIRFVRDANGTLCANAKTAP